MNVLFLTMSSAWADIEDRGIYTDLMRKFRDKGHKVYIVYPRERRTGLPTELLHNGGVHILGVRTLNVTQSHVIEKGVGQLFMEEQFCTAIKQYFSDIRFDIILYSTPPITFTKVIEYVKKRNPQAITYLLLKDIFPQNAVDIGMMSTTGIKGLLYRFFRHKEKQLYRISDYIGCMSRANVHYLLQHNPEIDAAKVEIAPNSYDNTPVETTTPFDSRAIRLRYHLPTDKPIFIYGGNMGRPQGIPFLIECMKAVCNRTDCHFLIIGNGTEFPKLMDFVKQYHPRAVTLMQHLPKNEYDNLTRACDVGMIFLDYRFTIPNYPSRLLPYLMERKPILAVTDEHSDIGSIAEANGYGYYVPSNSVDAFVQAIDKMLASPIVTMGDNGYRYYLNNYTTQHTYDAIVKHLR